MPNKKAQRDDNKNAVNTRGPPYTAGRRVNTGPFADQANKKRSFGTFAKPVRAVPALGRGGLVIGAPHAALLGRAIGSFGRLLKK